jgi:hypothetical protein
MERHELEDFIERIVFDANGPWDETVLDTCLKAINTCQRDACKQKYQEIAGALHTCECGKPQQFIGEQRARSANNQDSAD